MASIAMMVGGTIVNALASSGSTYLFSTMRELNAKEIEEEHKRHNKALEQLKTARSQWARHRMESLYYINDEFRKQGHSIKTFKDVESAMHEYFLVYGKTLDPMPRPTLSQFYSPSEAQKDHEIAFIVFRLSVVAIFSYTITYKL